MASRKRQVALSRSRERGRRSKADAAFDVCGSMTPLLIISRLPTTATSSLSESMPLLIPQLRVLSRDFYDTLQLPRGSVDRRVSAFKTPPFPFFYRSSRSPERVGMKDEGSRGEYTFSSSCLGIFRDRVVKKCDPFCSKEREEDEEEKGNTARSHPRTCVSLSDNAAIRSRGPRGKICHRIIWRSSRRWRHCGRWRGKK